jgi:hypothetical protein
MSILRDLHGGRDNDPRFGQRMRGQGVHAELLRSRFQAACRRLGLDAGPPTPLDHAVFRAPREAVGQLDLF